MDRSLASARAVRGRRCGRVAAGVGFGWLLQHPDSQHGRAGAPGSGRKAVGNNRARVIVLTTWGDKMLTGLITALVVLVVCIVIGALIVQLATKMAAGFKPTLGNAVVTVIVGIIAGAIVSYILQMVLGSTGSLIGLVVAFLVNAFIINLMIKAPGGGQMGFGKACLVSLVQYIIYIVIFIVLFFLGMGALTSMMAGAH